jgi:hypothetical protein
VSRGVALALVSALFAALGCQSPANRNPFQPPPPSTGSGTGNGGTGGPSGAVSIAIDTPTTNQSFGAGTLMDVSTRIDVTGGTDFLDNTSVKATVTSQGSSLVLENSKLPFVSGDVFAGRVSLGMDLVSGTYTLTVTAASSGGAVGSATVDFVVDAGPTVVVNSPTQGKSYKTSLTIEVVASDPFGLAGPPTCTVGDIPVTLTDAGVQDTFRGTITFADQMPPLFGDQLVTVTATNVNGRHTQVQVIFIIDNDGPTITLTLPVAGQISGGIIGISATINDNAGVLDSSVIAVIGDDTSTTVGSATGPIFVVPLAPTGSGIYTALFDSTLLTACPDPPATGICLVYPTISFRASDELGNETTVSYEFALDNRAPVADLDPHDVRTITKDRFCSRLFDPLALNIWVGDMPNDGAVVPQVFDLRARVQDDGNTPVGIKEVPISGLDPEQVNVYILDDVTQPIVVDVDGDGTCDAINPLLVPTTQPPTNNNQVLKVRLAGVQGQGKADFRSDTNPPPPAICNYDPAAQPPNILCDNGQPFTTITYAHGQPAIWSVEPINAIWCMGSQFDTRANNISEGWACMAVQATDKNGNTSVSAPMRVYIQYNGNGAGQPAPASLGTPPPCTGSWDRASNTVTAGSCTARRFDKVEYCLDGDCGLPYD